MRASLTISRIERLVLELYATKDNTSVYGDLSWYWPSEVTDWWFSWSAPEPLRDRTVSKYGLVILGFWFTLEVRRRDDP